MDGFAVSAGVQLVLSRRIRRSGTCPLHSVHGVLHHGRLRLVKDGRLFQIEV